MQRTVELDATLRVDFPEKHEIRKRTSATIMNLPRLPGDDKETHALNLDFSQDIEQDIRVGMQVTVNDGDILAIHLVIFDGDFCLGRGFGWVPFKQTASYAIAREDRHISLDCYVTYRGAEGTQGKSDEAKINGGAQT